MVQLACSTRGSSQVHRLGGELVDGQPETETDQRLGRDGPGEVGRRQDREADQPAGDQEAAHRDLDLGRRPQEAGQRAGGERRDRYDGHGQRRGRRRVAPAVDQEQDQQEQRRRERRRQQGEGQVGAHRRAVPDRSVRVGRGGWSGAHRERRRHGQHGDRHLHHEDRLPRERLREQPTRDRTGGRADHTGRDPGGDPAALAVHRDQQLEAPDQRQRATERLHAPSRDQHLDRLRHRAPRRGAGEHRDADRAEDPRVSPREAHRRRHRDEPQHEVERDQHPGDLRDGRVEVPEDVGQRQRHHRGVREHQRHGHREQWTRRHDAPSHLRSLHARACR